MSGLKSLAGLATGVFAIGAAQAASFTDADILNFALNLEYLEANFYYLAAFGTTIDVSNPASTAAGAPKITLSGTVGTPGTVTGGAKVPFGTVAVGSYATEVAVEEGKHVQLLLGALGSAAVAQPAINLGSSFQTLATAAGIPSGSASVRMLATRTFWSAHMCSKMSASPLITERHSPHYERESSRPRREFSLSRAITRAHPHHDQLPGSHRRYHRRVHQSYFYPPRNPFAGWSAGRGAWTIRRKSRRFRPGHFLRNPGRQRHHRNAHHRCRPGKRNRICRNTTQVLNIVTGGGAVTAQRSNPSSGSIFPGRTERGSERLQLKARPSPSPN